MIEATSCGGVVIYRGKILTLYKSYKNKYEGWVLPKGTVEAGEEYKETAVSDLQIISQYDILGGGRLNYLLGTVLCCI